MDDIGKMFNSHNIFSHVDLEVMSFAPSEYSKNQFVLQTLRCLKLSVWIMICDVLETGTLTSNVGNQLRDGKLFQIRIISIVAYNCVPMYIAYICVCDQTSENGPSWNKIQLIAKFFIFWLQYM